MFILLYLFGCLTLAIVTTTLTFRFIRPEDYVSRCNQVATLKKGEYKIGWAVCGFTYAEICIFKAKHIHIANRIFTRYVKLGSYEYSLNGDLLTLNQIESMNPEDKASLYKKALTNCLTKQNTIKANIQDYV